MIAFGILVGLFLIKVKELNEQTAILKQKENMFSNERKQNNQTFHHLKNVNSEKTHENEQLKKQLQEMKNETPRKSNKINFRRYFQVSVLNFSRYYFYQSWSKVRYCKW